MLVAIVVFDSVSVYSVVMIVDVVYVVDDYIANGVMSAVVIV